MDIIALVTSTKSGNKIRGCMPDGMCCITTAHEKLSGVLSRIPCRGIVVYALEAAPQALDGAEFTNLLRTTQTGECPVLLIGRLPEIEEHLAKARRPVLTRARFDPLDCKAIFKRWQNRGRAKAAGAR